MTRFKLIQVVGARPQIIKSAALTRAIKRGFSEEIELLTLQTGQHYDSAMSSDFYEELGLPEPDISFSLASSSGHAQQTAAMMSNCESAFTALRPDAVLVYGDTNSTLAAGLTAHKLGIPLLHVEAGLRSHNLQMPEECNRIATDHLSTLLFAPTLAAIEELNREGIIPHTGDASVAKPAVHIVGDVMYDNSRHYAEIAKANIDVPEKDFILATCHRPSNSDDPSVLERILATLEEIGGVHCPVLLPLHPRLKRHQSLLDSYSGSANLVLRTPFTYIEMMAHLSACTFVITDSGGLQKEAFFHRKACLVLREETEWGELVENGNSLLVGNDAQGIIDGAQSLLEKNLSYPSLYGKGNAAVRICEHILQFAKTC